MIRELLRESLDTQEILDEVSTAHSDVTKNDIYWQRHHMRKKGELE